MKYCLLLLSIALQLSSLAQEGQEKNARRKIGLKAGYNFSTVHMKNAGDLDLRNRQGLMVSGFFSPATRGILGYRSEVVYSRQGFEYAADESNTIITNDYLLLPQFTTINITRFVQLQLGGQIGYLLSAKSKNGSASFNMKEMVNRIDYGAAGGIEIYPFKGLILGGRYTMSFGDVYNTSSMPSNPYPSPYPLADLKSRNGVISFFAGYQF